MQAQYCTLDKGKPVYSKLLLSVKICIEIMKGMILAEYRAKLFLRAYINIVATKVLCLKKKHKLKFLY